MLPSVYTRAHAVSEIGTKIVQNGIAAIKGHSEGSKRTGDTGQKEHKGSKENALRATSKHVDEFVGVASAQLLPWMQER